MEEVLAEEVLADENETDSPNARTHLGSLDYGLTHHVRT